VVVVVRRIGTDSSAIKLTSDAADHSSAAVSGNRVVWVDGSVGARQVYTREMGVDGAAVRRLRVYLQSSNNGISGWKGCGHVATLVCG